MSKIKYILFRLALVIITLHTFIQHPHSDKLSKGQHFELHKKSNSIIGIIRLAFHENDESLDNLIYTKYERFNNKFFKHKTLYACTINNFTSIVSKHVSAITISCNNLSCLFFVKPNGLRGPPIMT